MKFLLQLLLLIVSTVVFAGDTLVRPGAMWKYSDQGIQFPGWNLSTYNDSSWSSGYAELGYGDNDEITAVTFGPDSNNRYIATYFRTNFISNTQYNGLRLYLKRDDGAIVYLNGVEVYRSNMPDGIVDSSTTALFSIQPVMEESFVPVTLSSSILVNGNNLISVEIHQNEPTSTDMSFDLSLIGDVSAEITRGPYLQMPTTNSMMVCYRTSCPDFSKILFGTSLQYSDSVTDTANVSEHAITLSNLQPNTKYFYAIYSANGKIAGDSTNYFFTASDVNTPRPLRLWTMGDFGTGTMLQKSTRDAYYNYSWNRYTDLILWLGDNAYPLASDEDYSTKVFYNQYENILKTTPVFSTAGNHELFNSSPGMQSGTYYDIFNFPMNGECGGVGSGSESYYSFNNSNVHFICLESNIDSFGLTQASYMTDWLRADLLANTMPWTIVFFHCTPYSKGYHDSDIEDNMKYMRENINPILESYNVDLVLTGHSHDYERSYLLKGHFGLSTSFVPSMRVDSGSGAFPDYYNKISSSDSGTVYAVVGCAGEVTSVQPDWPHPAMKTSLDTIYGSMVIDINGDTLEGKLITHTGAIADQFAIIKNINTSVAELGKQNELIIFPDPSRSQINVHYKQNEIQKLTVTIVDVQGKKLYLSKQKAAIFNEVIDISTLSPGNYFLLIENNSGVLKRGFIKE